MRGGSRLLLLVGVVIACSSSGSGSGGGGPQLVRSWTCCGGSSSCTCFEDTPNGATVCSSYVDTCAGSDGGAGCCVASRPHDKIRECACSPPGAACPEPDPSSTNVQHVDRCPP